jgi:hypothetical protein
MWDAFASSGLLLQQWLLARVPSVGSFCFPGVVFCSNRPCAITALLLAVCFHRCVRCVLGFGVWGLVYDGVGPATCRLCYFEAICVICCGKRSTGDPVGAGHSSALACLPAFSIAPVSCRFRKAEPSACACCTCCPAQHQEAAIAGTRRAANTTLFFYKTHFCPEKVLPRRVRVSQQGSAHQSDGAGQDHSSALA